MPRRVVGTMRASRSGSAPRIRPHGQVAPGGTGRGHGATRAGDDAARAAIASSDGADVAAMSAASVARRPGHAPMSAASVARRPGYGGIGRAGRTQSRACAEVRSVGAAPGGAMRLIDRAGRDGGCVGATPRAELEADRRLRPWARVARFPLRRFVARSLMASCRIRRSRGASRLVFRTARGALSKLLGKKGVPQASRNQFNLSMRASSVGPRNRLEGRRSRQRL